MADQLKSEIARIVHWKQIAAQHDARGALPWHLPEVGASLEAVSKIESKLGLKFSDDYRRFLTLADGWKAFYVFIDLFGTRDFLSERVQEVAQRPEVKSYFRDLGLSQQHVTPIGGSELEIDVFLHVTPNSPVLPGAVLWWAGDEIDRYESFSLFLGAMALYNEQIARKLTNSK